MMEEDEVKVALVIAHPDDECMFFSPTLSRLSARKLASPGSNSRAKSRRLRGVRVKWTVLCLSNGNACGLGKVREKELFESCATFQIKRDCVQVVDDPRLPDGMDIHWDPCVVADFIEQHIERHRCTHVISFDGLGISKHANHIACWRGLQSLKKKKDKLRGGESESERLSFWVQETGRGGLFQYFGLLTLVWQALVEAFQVGRRRRRGRGRETEQDRERAVLCIHYSLAGAFNAMKKHKSQLVWYRYLHIFFSRYIYINKLRKL